MEELVGNTASGPECFKSEDDLLKRMNNREKYPLLNQLISGNPVVKKLSNLPAFNEFTNYMVENYSFKILFKSSTRLFSTSFASAGYPFFLAFSNVYEIVLASEVYS